jgi:hypothetical protein
MNDMTRPGDVDPPYLYEGYRRTRLRAPRSRWCGFRPARWTYLSPRSAQLS